MRLSVILFHSVIWAVVEGEKSWVPCFFSGTSET